MKLLLNIDGSSFGNPGASRSGVVLRDSEGKVLVEHLGHGTNNRAELMVLLRSIELAEKLGCDELEERSDSQSVVLQMNGVYEIKSGDIRGLVLKVREKLVESPLKFSIVHVRRGFNKEADILAKKGAGFVV